MILILIDKTKIKEMFFLGFVYFSQVALYSYTFALNRYGITLFFIRYIIIGFGLNIFYNMIITRRIKNESANNNTGVQRRVKHKKYS